MSIIRKRILWITETAAMLALLICLQWVGQFIPDQTVKQLITGTCVNAVLAVTVLTAGMGSGITIALVSPVFAFLFKIAPNLITVPAIMLGNLCYVMLLGVIVGDSLKPVWKTVLGWLSASVAKFAVLYVLVVQIICGLASNALLGKKLGDTVLLAPKMLTMLPAMFSWLQLVTALLGGALALSIVPLIRKAIKR